jgi:putative nucleotidyltransferase with HDIG domain
VAIRVLLVDPDTKWLGEASAYLEKNLYEVKSVETGKDAQLAIYNETFFAVIINFETKNHPALMVLKFIKTNYPSQRIILTFENNKEFEEGNLDADKLKKMGVHDHIIKPFPLSQIQESLEGHQSIDELLGNITKREGQSDEAEVELGDDQFTKIKIDDFYSSQSVLFDVYIKLKSNRYVKILHTGDTFTRERIDRYKNEKGVEFLYITNADRRKYIKFTNFVGNKMIMSDKVAGDKKLSLMRMVSEKYLEEVYTHGLKPQVVDQGKEVCQNMFNMIEKQKDLYSLLRTYQDFDPNAFSHCYLVMLFSSLIIKQFDWQSKVTIEAAAMACMFHDIGKMKLPPEYKELRPADMSAEQLEVYKTHPTLGAEVVEGNRLLANSIKQIILQHHENHDGTGFPNNVRGSKIFTLAAIVHLADDFAHDIVDNKQAPIIALKAILGNPERVVLYNSKILENFIKVFANPDLIKKDGTVIPSNSRIVNTKKVS